MQEFKVGDYISTVYGRALVTGLVHYMDKDNNRILMGYDCRFYPGVFEEFQNKVFIGLDAIKFEGIKSK